MKQEILEYVKEHPGTSFAELDRIPGFHGSEHVLEWNGKLIWAGLTKDAADALVDLLSEKTLVAKRCSSFVYAVDGRMNISANWIPVTLYLPNQLKRTRR